MWEKIFLTLYRGVSVVTGFATADSYLQYVIIKTNDMQNCKECIWKKNVYSIGVHLSTQL